MNILLEIGDMYNVIDKNAYSMGFNTYDLELKFYSINENVLNSITQQLEEDLESLKEY